VLVMMIIVSDNTCTGTVCELVGLDAVNAYSRAAGMTGTVHRQAIPVDPDANTAPDLASTNVTTAADVGRLLERILRGARDPEAAAALGCSPAELTWRAGVDVLSLGATKNGALAAEAVVFFDPARAEGFAYRRKRGGHLFSKMRFLSAQLDAYLADGLWLRHAAHANRMAARLGDGLARLPGARLSHPVEANEVFVELPESAIAALEAAGFGFYRWDGAASPCLRLVTAFDTQARDVEALIATAGGG